MKEGEERVSGSQPRGKEESGKWGGDSKKGE